MTLVHLIARDIIQVFEEAGILLDYRMPESGQSFAKYGTDSRTSKGDDLFIAYRGVSYDAHSAVPSLQGQYPKMGFVLDSEDSYRSIPPGVFACLVRDSREAWAWLAAYRNGNPQRHLRLIGVTGTNGKTSTVWFIRQLLHSVQEPCLIMGTIGVYCGDEIFPASHTTPDPDELFRLLALARDRGVRWAAMEVSSHALVQKRIGPLRFDAAAFTSFSRDHLDFHSNMEEYFAAKWQLFTDYLKAQAVVYLSRDIADLIPKKTLNHELCFYGPDDAKALLRPQDASYAIHSMTLETTELQIAQGLKTWQGRLAFGADFAVANFTAAFLIIESLMPGRVQSEVWSTIEPVPGRFEPVKEASQHGLAVIVDYAHTPDALEKTLQKLKMMTQGQVWLVFGCGGDRDRGKRPLMGAVAEREADHVVVSSDNPRSEDPKFILQEIASGMSKVEQHKFIVDREAAIRFALLNAKPGDTVLIAGKGHEDYQIIGQQRFAFDDRLKAKQILMERPFNK